MSQFLDFCFYYEKTLFFLFISRVRVSLLFLMYLMPNGVFPSFQISSRRSPNWISSHGEIRFDEFWLKTVNSERFTRAIFNFH